MPKTPKTYPRSKDQPKSKPKAKASKAQPTEVSIFKSKYYWIFMSAVLIVFTIVVGFVVKISLAKELLILGSIFAVIGFGFYLAFKPAPTDKKRVLLILIGVSIIGFSIWALMIFFLFLTGSLNKILSLVGDVFFPVTTLIICLVIGAFIGDLIHKNMDIILDLFRSFRDRVTSSAPKMAKK